MASMKVAAGIALRAGERVFRDDGMRDLRAGESDYNWQLSREFNKGDTLKVGSTVEMVPSRLVYKEAEDVLPTQFENLT